MWSLGTGAAAPADLSGFVLSRLRGQLGSRRWNTVAADLGFSLPRSICRGWWWLGRRPAAWTTMDLSTDMVGEGRRCRCVVGLGMDQIWSSLTRDRRGWVWRHVAVAKDPSQAWSPWHLAQQWWWCSCSDGGFCATRCVLLPLRWSACSRSFGGLWDSWSGVRRNPCFGFPRLTMATPVGAVPFLEALS